MLSVINVSKIYKTKGGVVTKALDNVSIDFPSKGMIFLLGRSGSGKSTLLNVIGGLDKPDKGEVIIKGKSSKDFTGNDFDSYRNTFIGFIFQEYNILNEFNVEQNIGLALQLQGKKADKDKINQLLEQVDLKGVTKRKPNTLSGGQKQRIAIARALIKEPQIIMADEPTGALDSNTGKQVFDTLKKLSEEKLVIVVSHDREFAKQYGDRIVELKDGHIISDETKEFIEPENVSSNYSINGNGVIQIKDASKLTLNDTKAIIAAIKKNQGEVIISNKNTNEDVKKALKLRDDGSSEVFNSTKSISLEKYDGKQTKFIKSKMPISRAFKMGASGLKTKPIRLIFTILLSSISFAMFGIVSTFMMYNPNHTIKSSLEKADYVTESVVKTYSATPTAINYNYKTGKKDERVDNGVERSTYFGESELKEFNSKNNNRFAGAFKLNGGGNQIAISGYNPSNQDYYKYNYFLNISDCGEEFAKNNFELKSSKGHYPTNSNEIAISTYIADAILSDTSLNYTEYNNIIDLMSPIDITGYTKVGQFKKSLKITAVYKIADIPEKYAALQREKSSDVSDLQRSALNEEFNNFITNGFFLTGFVNDTFYKENIAAFKPVDNNNTSLPAVSIRGISYSSTKIGSSMDVEKSYISRVIDKDLLDELQYPVKYYDTNGETISSISLKDDEAIISLPSYYRALKDKEGSLGRLLNIFSNIGFGYDGSSEKLKYTTTSPYKYKLNATLKSKVDNEEEFVKLEDALNRLYSYVNNYSSTEYSGGKTQYEKDMTLLKEFVNSGYKDIFKKLYIYDLFSSCSYEFSTDPQYSEASNAYSRINAYINTKESDYESSQNLEDDINTIISFIKPKLQNENNKYIYVYLCNVLTSNSSSERQNILNSSNFYELQSDLWSDQPKEETFTGLKKIINNNFKDCIGVEASFTFNENQFGDTPYYGNSKQNYYYKDYNKIEGEFKIVGYYDSSYEGEPILTKNAFKNYVTDESSISYYLYKTDYKEPEDAKYSYIITKTNFSEKDIAVMVQSFKNYKYIMSNKIYTSVGRIVELVSNFKNIFFYVGLATGGLAVLLMVNFISASISAKKKDIGILRAVGAKGGDVFKIFYSESSIISLCCFLISTIGAGVACYFLDKFIGSSLSTLLGSSASVSIISFGILNVLIVLALSLLITILATLVPVIIASKKPPVESIRAL